MAQECEVVSTSSECDFDFGCIVFDSEGCEVCFMGKDDEGGENPKTFQHHWVFIDLDRGKSQSSSEKDPCFDATGVVNLRVYYIAFSNDDGTRLQCEKLFLLEPCGGPECDEKADFSFEIDGCKVQFTSSDPSGEHTWYLGDGSISKEVNPEHRYTENGTIPYYTVTHIVIDGEDEFICTKYVNPDCVRLCKEESDPNAPSDPDRIFAEDQGCGKFKFSITNPCDDPNNAMYYWDFGDGNTSTDANPTHSYNSNGSYKVTVFIKCEGEDEIERVCDTRVNVVCMGNPCIDDNCDDGVRNFFSFAQSRGSASCSELIIDFIPFCVKPGIGHRWFIHELDFMDWSPGRTNGCIGTINTYKNPSVEVTHIRTEDGIDKPESECSMEVELPPGIFIGCQCVSKAEGNAPGGDPSSINKNRTYSLDALTPDVLDDGGTGSQDVYINGTLIVDRDYSFSGTNIYMGMGGSIQIQDGYTLNLDGAFVAPEPGCGCSWMGIEVEEGGVLNMSNSTLKKAIYGINMFEGSELIMNDNTLLENYIGILGVDGAFMIPQFSGNNIIGGDVSLPCDCWQDDIIEGIGPTGTTYDPNNKDCYTGFGGYVNYSYAGIYIQGDKGTNLNLPAGGSPNTFLSLPVGIFITNANATIGGCKFISMGEFGYDNNGEDFDFACEALDENDNPIPGTFTSSNVETVAWGEGVYFIDLTGSHTLNQTGLSSGATFTNCYRCVFVNAGADNTRAFIQDNSAILIQAGIEIISSAGNVSFARVRDNSIFSNIDYGAGNLSGVFINDDDQSSSFFIVEDNFVLIDQPVRKPAGIQIEGLKPTDNGGFPNSNTPNSLVRVDDNQVTISKGKQGIAVNSIARAQIVHNDVTISDSSVDPSAAIELSAGSNHFFRCNDVVNSVPNANGRTGILVERGTDGTYRQNRMTNFASGMKFVNDCGEACIVHFNKFFGPMTTGLLYDLTGKTGDQSFPRNTWSGTFTNHAKHDGGSGGNFGESEHFVLFDPNSFEISPDNWFLPSIPPGNLAYPSACNIFAATSPPPTTIITNEDLLVAQNQNLYYSENDFYGKKQRLYEKLILNPEVV